MKLVRAQLATSLAEQARAALVSTDIGLAEDAEKAVAGFVHLLNAYREAVLITSTSSHPGYAFQDLSVAERSDFEMAETFVARLVRLSGTETPA